MSLLEMKNITSTPEFETVLDKIHQVLLDAGMTEKIEIGKIQFKSPALNGNCRRERRTKWVKIPKSDPPRYQMVVEYVVVCN